LPTAKGFAFLTSRVSSRPFLEVFSFPFRGKEGATEEFLLVPCMFVFRRIPYSSSVENFLFGSLQLIEEKVVSSTSFLFFPYSVEFRSDCRPFLPPSHRKRFSATTSLFRVVVLISFFLESVPFPFFWGYFYSRAVRRLLLTRGEPISSSGWKRSPFRFFSTGSANNPLLFFLRPSPRISTWSSLERGADSLPWSSRSSLPL